MAQYLTYEEYVAHGGAMEEAAYDFAELKARKRIDALTLGRVANMATVPEEVKAAMMEILQVDSTFSAAAQAAAPVAAAFTADGYSESFGSAEARTAAIERQLTASILALLDSVLDDEGTPLIFAGIPSAGEGWP